MLVQSNHRKQLVQCMYTVCVCVCTHHHNNDTTTAVRDTRINTMCTRSLHYHNYESCNFRQQPQLDLELKISS